MAEPVADYRCETGENPLWHPLERDLYWCDIPNGRIFRYDPPVNSHECCFECGAVGGFTIESDGALLLFMDGGFIQRLRDGELTPVIGNIVW